MQGQVTSASFAPSEDSNDGSVPTQIAKVRAKLSKLEEKHFNENVSLAKVLGFVIECSIRLNDGLSNVDKFNYLRGLVGKPAKSCIAGFSMTWGIICQLWTC